MMTGYESGPKPKPAAKKKGARPFGWRNVLNWMFAPSITLALWYMTLVFLFNLLNLYEVMEDIWDMLPIILISATLGVTLCGVQAWALPSHLMEYRQQWFWWTFATSITAFSVALILDESVFSYDLLQIDTWSEFTQHVPILLGLASPLLLAQSHLLRSMQHASRGTDFNSDSPLQRFAWLWWLPNLLFIAMLNVPPADYSVAWMTVSLVVWGAGMGLTLWWTLGRPIVAVSHPALT
jgi:hypothetical protein